MTNTSRLMPQILSQCYWPKMTTERKLDLIADFELSSGRPERAEYYSRLAADIREQCA